VEQTAEGIVAGQAVHQAQKAAQERLLRASEEPHVDGALATAQHGAQRDHQQFMEVMQPGIARARIFQPLPAVGELIHGGLPGCGVHTLR
jgi:hypothetical protein